MLPSLTAAFTVGLTLGSLVPYFPLSVCLALLVLVVGLTVCERRRLLTSLPATVGLCSVLVGVLYWMVAVEKPSHVSLVNSETEFSAVYSGRIIAPVQHVPDRLIMVVRLDGAGPDSGIPRLIRLTWRDPDRFLFQGDHIRFTATLRAPTGAVNPGGFDYAVYMRRQGIEALATITGTGRMTLLESGRTSMSWGLWNQIDRWRGSIRLAALQSLTQPALGLFLGIIIGDRGYLDPELRDQFMVTGTVHLLSISGSHLGLVALLTFALIRQSLVLLPQDWLLRVSRSITATRIAAVGTVFPATAYACLAGAELATVRALVMLLVTLLARWLGYEQRMLHAVGLAALAILLHDPQSLYDISFQLSFLSVCAIAWWLSRSDSSEAEEACSQSTAFANGIRWAKDGVVMSAVVTLATIPIVAMYFNQLPWLGLFTNILAVPVTGFLLVPLGLFGGLWHILEGGAVLPLAWLLQPLMDGFIECVKLFARIPAGEWHVASPSLLAIAVFYLLLGVFLLNPISRLYRWGAGTVLILILIWWAWSPRLFLDGDRFRVTFLDVGQGDSVVIEWPDGQVILIDGGATYERFDMGRGVVAPFLWQRGIRTIDHMIGTHPQLDHVGGLTWLLRHFSVKQYWGSGDQRDEPFYRRLQHALTQRGLNEQVVREGREIISSQNCQLLALNPPEVEEGLLNPQKKSREGKFLNDRSVVTELICGSHRMLFAADIEQEGLRRIKTPSLQKPVEVLKVPHHGALSSLSHAWIQEVSPRYAVFSAGSHNSFGHPAPLVLDAYASQGSSIYRTDQDGAVWFTGNSSGPGLQVHRARDGRVRPAVPFSCMLVCERSNWKILLDQLMEW